MILNRWNKWLFAPEGDSGSGGGGAGDPGAGGTPPSILAGSAGAEPWFTSLPDEFKANPYVAQSKDLAGFVKSAIDTKSMVGANVIKLPGEKATEQELNDFYSKLGRPADATAYTPTVQPKVENLLDKPVLEAMQTQFHKLGLSEAQGKGILDAYMGILNTGFEASEAQQTATREQGVATLKQEWGPQFDNNVKTAQLALRQLGGDELVAEINASGFGNNVAFIKFMHTVGMKLLDDSAVGGEGGGAFGGTPMAAQAELERLKLDNEFQAALNTQAHAGHKAAVDKWLDLHKKAFPGKQAE